MDANNRALRLLEQDAQGMYSRVDALSPFALQMPMVAAANVSLQAQASLEAHMVRVRSELRRRILSFIALVKATAASERSVVALQRRFALLKLYFQAGLSHFDIFAEALTQRSQHGMGVWLAGLDAAASDALDLPGFLQRPPLVCYVERGLGAAIRRARTRLPGGGESPIAIVRIPRERMVGVGIASSLFHEVGHQAAALLDLVNAMKRGMSAHKSPAGELPLAWRAWDRWISEIVADLWSVSRVGISATLGLVSVVSLPKAFVFRVSMEDPHPAPWVRVQISLSLGEALYPHPQWQALREVWLRMYPLAIAPAEQREPLAQLQAGIPALVDFMVALKPPSLRGGSVRDILRMPERSVQALQSSWRLWQREPARMNAAAPSHAFAVLGQARADGLLPARTEQRLLEALLQRWAMNSYAPPSPPAKAASVALAA